MLRGGAVLHDQSGDPAAQMPAAASSGPGARMDSRMMSGFNSQPFVHNASIATSSTEEILAQSNPLTNSVCSFVIPGQGSPGVFWDLSQTTLEIAYTRNNLGALNLSFFSQFMTSCLFFDKLSLQINGVELSDEASANLDISDATKIMLGQPHTPYGYGGSYKTVTSECTQNPANADLTITTASSVFPTNGIGECEIADTIYESGVGSLPAVTRGQLVNAERCFADRYRIFVDDVQGGKGVYKLMPQHPLWNKDNGVLLPAVFNTKIELSKSRGSNLFEYATTHQAGAAGDAVFQPTVESIRLFAKRIVTTEAGLRTYRSMLNSVGRLTVPVIRNVVTTHQLQTGATSIPLSQQGCRPRAIRVWCVPSANRQLTGNPARLPPDTMPL